LDLGGWQNGLSRTRLGKVLWGGGGRRLFYKMIIVRLGPRVPPKFARGEEAADLLRLRTKSRAALPILAKHQKSFNKQIQNDCCRMFKRFQLTCCTTARRLVSMARIVGQYLGAGVRNQNRGEVLPGLDGRGPRESFRSVASVVAWRRRVAGCRPGAAEGRSFFNGGKQILSAPFLPN